MLEWTRDQGVPHRGYPGGHRAQEPAEARGGTEDATCEGRSASEGKREAADNIVGAQSILTLSNDSFPATRTPGVKLGVDFTF